MACPPRYASWLCGLALILLGPQVSHAQDTTLVRVDVQGAIERALAISPEVGGVAVVRDFAARRSRFAWAARFLPEFTGTSAHAAAPGLDIPADNTFDDEALYLNPDVRNDWNNLRPLNQFEFEIVQPIWTGGQVNANIRAARHAVDIEEGRVQDKALEVALRTGELYYNLLLASSLARLTTEAGEVVDQAETTVRDLLEEGDPEVDDADLFQVLITKEEYQRRVVEVDQGQLTAQAALTRQLLLPPASLAAPDTSILEPLAWTLESLEVYLTQAQQRRPELSQAEAGVAARDALVDAARSDYFPKVGVVLSGRITLAAGRVRQPNPYVGDPFRSRRLRVGVGVRQQLNFLQTRGAVEEAVAEREEVRFQLEAATQLVQFEVEQAYRQVLTAEAALNAGAESLRLSGEWLRTEQINFDLGLGSTENLILAVQANLELQAQSFEAVRDYNVAVLRLLDATGTLIEVVQSGMLVDPL
ncbi:MAG: TolC family protein [Bacteroidota bacterium]